VKHILDKTLRAGLLLLLTCTATGAGAGMVETAVDYRVGDRTHRGFFYHDDATDRDRPLLLLYPNWLGTTRANRAQAAEIAGQDYVVFVADMYGAESQPADTEAAGAAVGGLYGDRAELRKRAATAQRQAISAADREDLPVREGQIAAIGFCFGGATVLEMARDGAELAAVVSLHGNLALEAEAPAPRIRTRILALHGDADPYVPPEQVEAFVSEMREHKPDWQLVSYGGAVHSFTDPHADQPGAAMYDEKIARRAFASMRDFLNESFSATP
jgi:dienelactone hydrolase